MIVTYLQKMNAVKIEFNPQNTSETEAIRFLCTELDHHTRTDLFNGKLLIHNIEVQE